MVNYKNSLSSGISEGKSFYDSLYADYLEDSHPCLGSPVILEYLGVQGKMLNSFFYMPEFGDVKSTVSDDFEYISFKDNRKILNLDFNKNKSGLYVSMRPTDEIVRPMTSSIELLSGDFARENIENKFSIVLNDFLKIS